MAVLHCHSAAVLHPPGSRRPTCRPSRAWARCVAPDAASSASRTRRSASERARSESVCSLANPLLALSATFSEAASCCLRDCGDLGF